MDKYIKYSDIPFYIIETEERCHNDKWTETHEIAYKAEIDQIPAADVAPVKHGQWVFYHYELYGCYYECSNCKYESNKKTNYCPNCGAKMDGETNG